MQIFPLAFTNTYMQVGEGTNQKRMTQDAPYESGLFLFKKKEKKPWTFESKIHFWDIICPSPLEIKGY